MMRLRYGFAIVTLFVVSCLPFAAVFSQPLHPAYYNQSYFNEKTLYQPGANVHTSVKPYFLPEIQSLITNDTAQHEKDAHLWAKIKHKFTQTHFFTIRSKDIHVTIDPLLQWEGGRESGNSDLLYKNTRGFMLEGNIGKNVAFASRFYENQATFCGYMDDFIRAKGVVPGQGAVKNFKGDGFDFSRSEAYVSYSPSSYFNFQFGHGKNFFGDGYRSLLLSDNAFSYPFLKITTNIWKIKYINLYMQLQDKNLPYSKNLGYQKKYATMQYLSYQIHPRVQIGLFEAIVWEAQDSSGYRGFELNYLDPVIFLRPVEFSVGSPDNALMGVNLNVKIGKHSVAYGQLLLDEFKLKEMTKGNGWWGNKFGWQLGGKMFDALNIPDLYLQAEFNSVRPYTYSHWSSLQNYGHYNQSLAHPLGANFNELVGIVRYNYHRWYASLKFNYALYGLDTTGRDFGKDIYLSYDDHVSDYDNKIGQGLRTNLYMAKAELSYLINPAYNLNIYGGYLYRKETNKHYTDDTSFVYFGIRTSVENIYDDF